MTANVSLMYSYQICSGKWNLLSTRVSNCSINQLTTIGEITRSMAKPCTCLKKKCHQTDAGRWHRNTPPDVSLLIKADSNIGWNIKVHKRLLVLMMSIMSIMMMMSIIPLPPCRSRCCSVLTLSWRRRQLVLCDWIYRCDNYVATDYQGLWLSAETKLCRSANLPPDTVGAKLPPKLAYIPLFTIEVLM